VNASDERAREALLVARIDALARRLERPGPAAEPTGRAASAA
jgi:hypothetical protein